MAHYYVDERNGCIAVRKDIGEEKSQGCDADLPDVVAFWFGKSSYNNEGMVSWSIEPWQREKAIELCTILNQAGHPA